MVLLPTRPADAHLAHRGSAPEHLQAVADAVVAHGVPGVTILSRDGHTNVTAVAGTSDLATGERVDPDDRFRVGSITKSFIATVTLQLEGERRLDVDDSIEHWLPGLVPGGDQITIRQLLNQTSGLYDYLNDGDATALSPYFDRHDWTHVWEPHELLAIATAHPPHFPPGTTWRYSNTNYVVLGLIIEAVTGHRVSAEVTGRIVRPLGLRDTSFPTTDADIRGDHLHGFLLNLPPESGLPPTFDITTLSPSLYGAAGAMISNGHDLARFYRALFAGWLLRPEQQTELRQTSPASEQLDYGLGVYRLQTPCGPAWGHDGGVFGYEAFALMTEDGHRQAVLAINSDRVLSAQNDQDVFTALMTGLCGPQPSAAGTSTSSAPQDVSG